MWKDHRDPVPGTVFCCQRYRHWHRRIMVQSKHDRTPDIAVCILYDSRIWISCGNGCAVCIVPFVGLFTNDGAVQILEDSIYEVRDCVFAGSTFLLKRIFLCIWLVYRIIYPQFHIYRMCQNSIVLLCGNAFPDTLFPMGCAAPAGSIISIIICVGVLIWMNKHTEKYMERT